MADFPVDAAQIVALWMESIFYGAYPHMSPNELLILTILGL